jgi:NIMA-interacting peptidyl-prolyl cis-trans isomerase 4
LKAGAKFDEVAKEFSEDKARVGEDYHPSEYVANTNGVKGGALGWKKRGDLDTTFEEAAFELESSTTASPKYKEVKTPFGYHILMVEGRK